MENDGEFSFVEFFHFISPAGGVPLPAASASQATLLLKSLQDLSGAAFTVESGGKTHGTQVP